MLSRFRLAVAVCLVLVLVLLAALPAWRDPVVESESVGDATFTNADCLRCHEDAARQWRQSLHAQAWVSSPVQAAFRHFGHDRKCESCHAPRPVFVVGLDAPVELRSTDRDSGVNCLTCHLLPGGEVAGRTTRDDAPCRPRATPELTTSRHCGGCHEAIFEDWEGSRYAAANQTCQDCHMRSRTADGEVLSHVCLGGHDDELVRSGVQLECRLEEDFLIVTVTNHATGHNFPGERHNRVLSLEVIETLPDGEIVLAEQRLIKGITPFRGESSSEMLRCDQTYSDRFEVADGATRVRVQLLFKRFPWMSTSDALVVHEREITPP